MDTEMKTYDVQGEVEVTITITVEAENEEQAREIAIDSFSDEMLMRADDVGYFVVQDVYEG